MELLTTVEEFERRIPGGIPAEHHDRAAALLEDASRLIYAEAGTDWSESGAEAPGVAVTVCIAAAKRAFLNAEGVRAVSVDNYSTTYASSSPDVYLTDAEKNLIRRSAGRAGLWALPTTRGGPDVPVVVDEHELDISELRDILGKG